MTVMTISVAFDYRQVRMVQDLDPASDTTIFSFLDGGTIYEQDIAHVMLRALQDGDVAVDVGANVGFFTVLLATLVGPRGRVVAFEPGGDNLHRLQRNIAASGCRNVTVIDKPTADRPGPVRFYLNSDASGGHALWDPAAFPGNVQSQAQQRMVRLDATTLDRELRQQGLPPPKLIKIDTEGAEHLVLAGAAELLRTHQVPFVLAELHEFGLQRLGSSQQALRAMMAGYGYDTFGLYFDGSLPKLIPPGTTLQPPHIINLLFSTADDVARLWPVERFDSTATRPANT